MKLVNQIGPENALMIWETVERETAKCLSNALKKMR